MFATKNKLAEIEGKGEITYKIQVENTVQQVIAAYFNVAQQQKLIDAINVNISIDSERVALAQTKLEIGSGSRLDVLQGRVDMNEQISSLMKQQALLEESKDNLNYLLSRKVGTAFTVKDSIVISYNLPADSLRSSIMQTNYSILSAQRDQRISMWGLKEAQSLHLPTVGFSAGYNYLRTSSQAGLILLNQNNGYNYGVNLNWNLFNGFDVSRQVKNARLSYASSGYYLDDIKYQVNTALEKAIRDFNNNINIFHLEQSNILLAQENLDIALERFRSGLSNSLELKEAQRSFQDAEVRLVQIQYQSKLSETELMKLNGELVK
jgi:outer membrane protein TolC